jgi:hypothetical protein
MADDNGGGGGSTGVVACTRDFYRGCHFGGSRLAGGLVRQPTYPGERQRDNSAAATATTVRTEIVAVRIRRLTSHSGGSIWRTIMVEVVAAPVWLRCW